MPIPVEGGLQARSQRGRIGESWWSGRFLAVLESFGVGSRLQRGKNYARKGQVLSMQVAPGQVSASVQGSRKKPYRVFIETATLSAREWSSVEDAMSARASFVARLLAGEMPDDIEEAFAASSCSLFPDSSEGIDSACSCPDWENPCKHIAAVYYLLAEAFDTDPFLIFAWRGREKDSLLDALRARRRAGDGGRATAGSAASGEGARRGRTLGGGGRDEDTEERIGPLGWPSGPGETASAPRGSGDRAEISASAGGVFDFWRSSIDPSDLEVRPRQVAVADLVLRQLDPAALGADAQKILDRLRPMYETIVTSAMRALEGATDISAPSGIRRSSDPL